MLQTIHDKSKGILGIVIVILIGATFALWGIGDYLSGATEKAAARVDGAEISQSEFEQGMARQRQRLEQMFQGEVPDSPLFEQQMKQQVLDQLITQRVLQKMAQDEGYRVADQVLAQRIKAMEAFQQDGVFVKDSYQAIVESQGMSVKEFENLFRTDLTVQQLQDAVMGSAIIGKTELNIINRLQKQSRTINYLQFDNRLYTDSVEVTEAEISDYYDRNKARYMHPETVSISYVELKASDLASDIPVDEEAVRRLYDDYVSSLAGREQRKARHILIQAAADADAEALKASESKLQDLLGRIRNGESFAELAKSASEDPGSAANGGDLGWVSKGMMVPEFETALFKLDKGQVSDIVKSSFGYHIIQLDDIKSESVDSFESKQAELTEQYKSQLLEDSFYEKSELMATTAYENDQSLQEVADVMGLTIKTTTAFSRTGGPGVATNDKVRKAAFSPTVLSEGRNSEIIEVEKNHALVLRVSNHTEARQKTLDEVKTQVTAALRSEKAKSKAQEAALAALVKLEQGESMDSVAGTAKVVKAGAVTRSSQSVSPQLLNAAFSMKKPADKPVYKVVDLTSGAAVIELTEVIQPVEASSEELGVLVSQFSSEQANRDMMAVIDYLKSQSDISRSDEL